MSDAPDPVPDEPDGTGDPPHPAGPWGELPPDATEGDPDWEGES